MSTMAAEKIRLNGGPLHGQVHTLASKVSRLEITRDQLPEGWRGRPEDREGQRLQKGTYTPVTDYPGEFEWDGWRP